MGGSSRIAFLQVYRDLQEDQDQQQDLLKFCFHFLQYIQSAGSISRELLKAVRSLGLADPYAIFVISRSKSYTGDRIFSDFFTRNRLFFQSCTASRRRIISVLSISGCSTYFSMYELPLLSLFYREPTEGDPLFCFSRRVSQSSRFLLVELSIIINLPAA